MTKEEYQEKLKEKAKLETEFFKLFINLFVEYPELKTKEFSKNYIAKIFDKNSYFEEIKNFLAKENHDVSKKYISFLNQISFLNDQEKTYREEIAKVRTESHATINANQSFFEYRRESKELLLHYESKLKEVTKALKDLEKERNNLFLVQIEDLFDKINNIKNEIYKYDYYEFLKINEDEYIRDNYTAYVDRKKQLLGASIWKHPLIKQFDRCSFYDAVMIFLHDYFNNQYYFEKEKSLEDNCNSNEFGLNEQYEAKIKSMSNGLIMKECLKKYGVFMGDSYTFDIRDENGNWQDEWEKLYGKDDNEFN